jgi:hypothetical protein
LNGGIHAARGEITLADGASRKNHIQAKPGRVISPAAVPLTLEESEVNAVIGAINSLSGTLVDATIRIRLKGDLP